VPSDGAPALSSGKQRAIAEGYFSAVTRVAMQVKSRFWESSGLSGYGSSDDPMELWHTTFGRPGPAGMLLAYFKHDGAREVGALPPERRAADGIRRVARLLLGLEQQVTATAVHVWAEDPCAGGAYLQFLPGQLYELKPHSARAEGRVHFAGDHTSHFPQLDAGRTHVRPSRRRRDPRAFEAFPGTLERTGSVPDLPEHDALPPAVGTDVPSQGTPLSRGFHAH
jgi:monoamine oxidase